MATPQETSRDVMSKVNSVIAALDSYPELSSTNTQSSFSMSANPIGLFVDFFRLTKGYDWLINTISKFISYGLPALELAVKGVLLSNIKNMLSCSVNPIITENMINNGIVFDINQIDLLNIFSFSPLDKRTDNLGRYYYFGCDPKDGIETIDDVKKSRDFNAVLWYCKNTPGERVVWKRDSDVGKPYVIQYKNNKWLKQVKSNGIATIEFNGRASGLSDAEGNSVYVQEPISNCIHVYIGCTVPTTETNHASDITKCTDMIYRYNKLKNELKNISERINVAADYNKDIITKTQANGEAFNDIHNLWSEDIILVNKIRFAIEGKKSDNQDTCLPMNQILDTSTFEFGTTHEILNIDPDLMESNIVLTQYSKIDYLNQDSGLNKNYPSAISNYYYLHPLFEWNTDFIMSMKLFDEKVVTAQLLEALTKCLTLNGNINITPQMQFLQEQLRELVTKTIETDEGTISDCFFSFTNDSYNNLLNEVELNRLNLHSLNSQTVNEVPSAEDIMSSLNTLSHDASKEELQSVVSSSLFNAVGGTNSVTDGYQNFSFDVGANFSMIDNLLTQLTYVIVLSVLQPKIYVLLMANFQMLGNEPNFSLPKFIQQFSDLISQLIKEIRDNIFEYFKDELLKVLNELIKTLAIKLTREQYQYYTTLLTHCIACFKLHRGQFDWTQDDVNYADITELNQTENQEC